MGAGFLGSPAEAGATAAKAAGGYASGHAAPASTADFGRIFPKLPPFAEANDRVRAALREVGNRAGLPQLSAIDRPTTINITTTHTRCHANRDRSGGLRWHQLK